MDTLSTAILLGLFALIVSELTGLALGRLVSLLRPDLDPSVIGTYIQRISTPVITTSSALVLEDSVGAIVLLAGASAAVALLLTRWLSRETVIVPTAGGRRR